MNANGAPKSGNLYDKDKARTILKNNNYSFDAGENSTIFINSINVGRFDENSGFVRVEYKCPGITENKEGGSLNLPEAIEFRNVLRAHQIPYQEVPPAKEVADKLKARVSELESLASGIV